MCWPSRNAPRTGSPNEHAAEVHRAGVMTKMHATSLSHLVRVMLPAPLDGREHAELKELFLNCVTSKRVPRFRDQ